jgi:hypothetical protein
MVMLHLFGWLRQPAQRYRESKCRDAADNSSGNKNYCGFGFVIAAFTIFIFG